MDTVYDLFDWMGVHSIPGNLDIHQFPIVWEPGEVAVASESYCLRLLKALCYWNQEGRCVCTKPLGQDVDGHHALVTRKDAQGSKHKFLIHHPYNLIAIHRSCHINIQRDESVDFLIGLYGYDSVSQWYNELPFVVVKERNIFAHLRR